jgi:hypothetical protein
MKWKTIVILLTLMVLAAVPAVCGQSQAATPHCSMMEAAKTQDAKQSDPHAQHHTGVNERGDHAMGFSHAKTTHHFRLTRDGGVIEVSANDAKDAESRDQIHMHLAHIAVLFKQGDFSKPMFTHGNVPPGVPVMTQLKAEIEYAYAETERGGNVRLTTTNAEALKAIHEFLRFQIKDHETGDSLEVGERN